MKILKKLTLKHIRLNRKRATVTIIGIMLSTAMMLTIGLMFSSISGTVKDNAIDTYGDYHISYRYVEQDKFNSLINQSNVESYYMTKLIAVEEVDEFNFVSINEGDQLMLEQLNVEKGRLPKNDTEIIVTEQYLKNNDIKIGDKITIEAGSAYVNSKGERQDLKHIQYLTTDAEYYHFIEDNEYSGHSFDIDNINEYEYTVVGSYEQNGMHYFSTSLYTLNNNMDTNDAVLFMKYTNPKEARIIQKDTVEKYVVESEYLKSNFTPSFNYDYIPKYVSSSNDQLLLFYTGFSFENLNVAFGALLSFILIILSVGCIIVIYNSFAISAIDRKREFGIYSSVGATSKQLKYSMYYEAMILGGTGIVLGMILAQITSLSIIRLIIHYTELLTTQGDFPFEIKLHMNLILYVIPLIFMIIVIFLSSYIPARRSAGVSAIDLIKQKDDIKLSSREVKSNFLVKKLFKAEGVLAHKNMKRNKKRYRITLISLVTSVVLFITFSTISEIYDIALQFNTDYEYDLLVMANSMGEDENTNIDQLESVLKDTSYVKTNAMWSLIEDKDGVLSDEYVEYYQDIYEGQVGYSVIDVSIIAVEDDAYNRVLEDYNLFGSDSIVVNNVNVTRRGKNEIKFSQIKPIREEISKLNLLYTDKNQDKLMEFSNISFVDAISVDEVPIVASSSTTLILVTSDSNLMKIGRDNGASFNDDSSYSSFSTLSPQYRVITDNTQSILDEINDLDLANVYAYSPTLENQMRNNLFTLAKIIIYLFIAVTVLIGVTSVFNTVYTSIILRRREFAMLRSIGMDKQGFNRILVYESILFSFKTIIIAFPISAFLIIQFNRLLSPIFTGESLIVPWSAFAFSMFAIGIIMLLISLYSSKEIKQENILESLRKEID